MYSYGTQKVCRSDIRQLLLLLPSPQQSTFCSDCFNQRNDYSWILCFPLKGQAASTAQRLQTKQLVQFSWYCTVSKVERLRCLHFFVDDFWWTKLPNCVFSLKSFCYLWRVDGRVSSASKKVCNKKIPSARPKSYILPIITESLEKISKPFFAAGFWRC